MGVSSLAAIPAASFQVAANGARSLATGFGLGSAFDAVGQYLGGEDYRPMQTINAGVASAVAYPLAGAKYLTNVLWGGVAGGGSTVLNNFVYRENADVISSTLQGSVAGGLSTGVGSALGFFAGKYLPKRIGATIDPNKPILLQNRGVINPYPVHVETIFRDFSSGVINTGWNLRD